ncbi:MAG: hypothetical protein NTY19_02985 [Planctomycetota bacterium]|nr:hypothetical protein [Planctomycetota bacterium]
MSEFLLTFPVFIVVGVDRKSHRYMPATATHTDGRRFLLAFTERGYAEDWWEFIHRDGVVWEIDQRAFQEHLGLFEEWVSCMLDSTLGREETSQEDCSKLRISGGDPVDPGDWFPLGYGFENGEYLDDDVVEAFPLLAKMTRIAALVSIASNA